MADGEQVVLVLAAFILDEDLRALSLVVDAVGGQDRRQEVPLGQVLVVCYCQAHVGGLVVGTRAVDLVTLLRVGVTRGVAQVLVLALVVAAVSAGVAFEHHEGLAGVCRVSEGVRVAEREARVLGLVLVQLSVRLQQLGVLEAVEGHAVLVGVDLAQRLGDDGVRGNSAAAGVALLDVVERGGRVEHVHLVRPS